MNDELRNYPSPWMSIWVQRLGMVAVGVYGAVVHAWFSVVIAVIFLALHTWMIHRFRQEKVARDAWFADVMRQLDQEGS